MFEHSKVVCLTGFSSEPQFEQYISIISSLNMIYTSRLSEKTDVLISNTVATEKYKVARAYKRPIICVHIEWLIHSHQNNYVLAPQPYQVKQLFFGIEVFLLQKQAKEMQKIKEILEKEGAVVEQINEKELQAQKTCLNQVVLIDKDSLDTRKIIQLPSSSYQIVTLEWFQQSLKAKQCKFPRDYSVNSCYRSNIQMSQHTKKMKAKLDFCLAQNYIKGRKGDSPMLEGLIFHLHPTVENQLSSSLKKLIAINGGFYLDCIANSTTHILTDSIPESQYQNLKSGLLVFVVRVEWLIDCIYLDKKLDEADYVLRSFESSSAYRKTLQDSNVEQNSLLPYFRQNHQEVPYLLKKSISLNSSHQSRKGKKKVIKSSLFKGYHFYIQSSQRKDTSLKYLGSEIKRHEGEVFQARNLINSERCYYVMKDDRKWRERTFLLVRQTKGKQIRPVSYRWVRQCIQRQMFIDIQHTDSYIYHPLSCKTPIRSFHTLVFQVVGVDSIKKLRLKQLFNLLGSLKTKPNKREVTHCLCGQNYKEVDLFHSLMQQNQRVVFVKWEWLIECSKKGVIVEVEKFLCQPLRDVTLEVNSTKEDLLCDNNGPEETE